MDSLIDEIDSLVAPDLSSSAPDWCDNCQSLRKDLKKLQDEQEQSFVKLKQKIISTDLLIKKYKSKCEDYDVQFKKNEEATKRADKYQRQSEILETQLKATLMETEPLRVAKTALESEVKQKGVEIEELKHKLVITEGAQRQFEHLNKSSTVDIEKLEAEKRALNVRIKVLESGKVTKEAAKELKVEIHTLKKENSCLKKREKQLERKLESALSKIDQLTEKLKENKMVPLERRRRTTSGSLLSPVRSPNRSPRARQPTSGASPKKVGPKSSPKQSISVERTKVIESEDSDDKDSSDDDAMSVFSVKWTFSPVMQCLSPLPPSPAHQSHTTETQMSWTDTRLSDDDNVSDIADELEQQLYRDSLPDEEEQHEETKTKNEDVSQNSEQELNDAESAGVVDVEVDNYVNKVNSELNSNNEHELNKKHLDESQHSLKPTEEESPSPSEIAEDINGNISCQKVDPECTETRSNDKKAHLSDNSIKDECLETVSAADTNKLDDKKSVKERLAASIEIVSPKASKTRTVHKSGGSAKSEIRRDLIDLKSPDSLRKQSSKPSVKADTTNEAGENKDIVNSAVTESLPRNDTLEFDPVVGEDAEIVHEKKAVESIQTPYVTETSSTENTITTSDIDVEKCSIEKGLQVNKDTIKTKSLDTQVLPSSHEKGLDVCRESAKTNMSNTQNLSSSDDKELVREVQGEVQIDIREEVEPVDFLRKTPPPLRGYLMRQNCVQKQGDSSMDNVNSKAISQIRSKTKMTYMNFQKASYGTLEEEINNLQESNDYTVLTRETPQRVSKTRRGKRLKSIQNNLKSNCKFRDLDSAADSDERLEQCNIASAFVKHTPKEKKNIKSDFCDSRETNCATVCTVNKPKESHADVSDTPVKTGHMDDNGLRTRNSSDQKVGNEASSKELCNDKEISDNKSKIKNDDKGCSPCTTNLHENIQNDKKKDGYNECMHVALAELETSINEAFEHDKAKHKNENIKECNGESSAITNAENELIPTEILNDSGHISADKSEHLDLSNISDEHKHVNTAVMASRQMSTGFIVNQGSVERAPSIESPVYNQASPVCDRERNKQKPLGTPPLSRQRNIHSCETIFEECEINEDHKTNISEESGVILGIDDLFGDVKSDKENVQDMLSSSIKSEEGSQPFKNDTKTENCEQTDSLEIEHLDHTSAKILSANSSNENETKTDEGSNVKPLKSSIIDKNSRKSSSDNINEPGCSYHYEDFQSSLVPTHDSEFVTVTSTTTLTTSSRLLACTPDNLDGDSFIVCQSQSRSTTPSICSIDMSTPPLSPLSVSPFDFIIPVSPLPPSPVQQVEDRVSPLSPEHSVEHLDDIIEESASNENEKNVGNIPLVMTPEKPIPEKLMEYSPVPDLISPIKTPKHASIHRKKKKSGKGKLEMPTDRLDVNSPVKFGSKVPVGVLTVKPKVDSIPPNFDGIASIGTCKVNRSSVKHLDLRKHVTLKESADIWSSKESVFKRKVGKTPEQTAVRSGNVESSLNSTSDINVLKPSICNDSSLTDGKENDQNITSKTGTNKLMKINETGDVNDIKMNAKGDNNDNTITVNATSDYKVGNSGDNETSIIKCSDDTLKVEETDLPADEKFQDKLEHKTDKREADILPVGYSDPLMDSKRKTRMAHQPRSQSLILRKPPVIIEPTFQIPVQGTRRKRKSQDSTDKDVVPKKQAKGVIFQKKKADLDPTNQESCRKMEAFLKSSERAEHFINSVKDIPAEKSAGLYIADICLECIGRVKSDMLETVYHSCDTGAYLTLKDDLPFLNNIEKKAVVLLATISRNTQMGIHTDGILKLVWTYIFTKELTVTMVGKMSLAKIFTAVCLKEGDIEQVRVLIYNIATCGYLNPCLFVVPVVSVWPEVLRKHGTSDGVQPHSMLSVLEYVITKSLLGQGTSSSKMVLTILEKLCNWSEVLESPETLLKSLTTCLFEISSEHPADSSCTFEIVKACKLLLMHENWAWFKENFINRQGLQPAVNRYLCKSGTVASNYVCAVLEITGSMITYQSETLKQRDLQKICKTWLMAILSKQQGDPLVQRCCLDTILEIAVFNPLVISDLRTWFKKIHENAVEGYAERLETLRQALKVDCEPFVKR